MKVETGSADQNRHANVNKDHAALPPIVGQSALPAHTWRKSDCTDNLNTATFNCQVRNSALRAFRVARCEVWQQDFLKLHLPDNHFDGVFANAALFHVPSRELPRVLLELKASLKPGRVLFSSNPRGHNEEGGTQGRYGVYHNLDAWRRYMSVAGFVELSHNYRPAGVPPERQPLVGERLAPVDMKRSWDWT